MNAYPPRPPEGIVQFQRDKSALVLINPKTHFSPYIEWDRVARIEYLDQDGTIVGSSTPTEAQQDTKVAVPQTWEVEGSGGKIYTVISDGGKWTCTCVAGSFGRECKHVKGKREEVSAT